MKLSIFDALRLITMGEAQLVQFVCQKRVGTDKGASIAPVVEQLFVECDTHTLEEVQTLVASLEQVEAAAG